MGGRGSSGGGAGTRKSEKPSYYGETEKAVQLRIRVNDYDLEKEKSRIVWVPKSQLADNGKPGEWITGQKAQEFYSRNRSSSQFSVIWEDASGKQFSASKTAGEIQRETARLKKFQAGVSSYSALIEEAKSLGIKGVRKGMKRATIERKIRERKNK